MNDIQTDAPLDQAPLRYELAITIAAAFIGAIDGFFLAGVGTILILYLTMTSEQLSFFYGASVFIVGAAIVGAIVGFCIGVYAGFRLSSSSWYSSAHYILAASLCIPLIIVTLLWFFLAKI